MWEDESTSLRKRWGSEKLIGKGEARVNLGGKAKIINDRTTKALI